MSLRAVLLGLTGAVIVCFVTYFNDNVIRQTFLIGNHLPIVVYGLLIMCLVVYNPLAARFFPRGRLTGAELAVVMAIILAACAVPGGGLMRTFTPSILMPHRLERTEPGWRWEDAEGRQTGALDLVPRRMLVEVDKGNYDTVVNGYTRGLGRGGESIALGGVPWGAWVRALAFWVPLSFVLWAGLIALSVVLHRQWADHEQIAYPVAGFTKELLPAEDRARGSVFEDRRFWIAFAVVLMIHMNNYAYAWFPGWVRIPLDLDFTSLAATFPNLHPQRPVIYFTVLGFAYFVATDVSLSIAIGPTIFILLQAAMAGYGMPLRGGGSFAPNIDKFMTFGAYMGVLVALAFAGRHYYASVMMRALGISRGDDVERQSIWAFRVFLACLAAFVTLLVLVGLDWQLAVLYTLGTVAIYMVISRIVAETGCFWVQVSFFPCVIIAGFFGVGALGPRVLATLFLLSTALVLIDPRECLMPFVINSLKVLELKKVKAGSVAPYLAAVLLVGLAVAVPVTLYMQYDRGANLDDAWATQSVPRAPFEAAMRGRTRLLAQGQLGAAESVSGFGRFLAISPERGTLAAFAVGLGLVLLLTAARMRIARWPIHPVIFLLWSSWSAYHFAASFFLGWLVKTLVMKYGGANTYQRLKPIMIGLIAGEMLAGLATTVIGAVYYAATGRPPVDFRILPG